MLNLIAALKSSVDLSFLPGKARMACTSKISIFGSQHVPKQSASTLVFHKTCAKRRSPSSESRALIEYDHETSRFFAIQLLRPSVVSLMDALKSS